MATDCCPDEVAVERVAASLPLAFVIGDDFPFAVTVNRNLSGYTYAASIVNAATGSSVCNFTISAAPVTVAGATHTRIQLSLTEIQTALVVPPHSYRWFLRWTSPSGDTRTALAGRVRALKR